MAPKNGTSIIKSEISFIISALNWHNRFSNRSNNEDSIYKSLIQLRMKMNEIDEFYSIEPIVYLSPFLNLLKSENVNGLITDQALSSIEKFLSYGFIDSSILKYNDSLDPNLLPAAAEAISIAIAKTIFLPSNNKQIDESVLMKILQVIRTLILLPIGAYISNESIMALIKNCFKICLDKNISDILRKCAEHTLASIIQLFFSRIPQLMSVSIENASHSNKKNDFVSGLKTSDGSFINDNHNVTTSKDETSKEIESIQKKEEANPKTQVKPYDLKALYDLLNYMNDLLNPETNSDIAILTSLNLLTIALETGADALSKCDSLLHIVKSRLTKNIVLLLQNERMAIFTGTCRLAFLLFESMRAHLWLQMEVFFLRIIDIISVENTKSDFDLKDIALDLITQLLMIPGMMNELYYNYDCSPYTSSVLSLLCEMLSKNVYPMTKQSLYPISNLEALLCMIDIISVNTKQKSVNKSSKNRHFQCRPELSDDRINQMVEYKHHLIAGSEKFNKKPSEGIKYLQKNGILKDPFDPSEMACFLIENPRLDKKVIGDYISTRKNSQVLSFFVKKLNFENTRIDEAIRLFLEVFRLPGEAPLIQHLIEYFSEEWIQSNPNVFANVDSAFTLSYAILMLNTDQHNPNSKKQNVPMNMSAFQRNLKGMNNGEDFDLNILAEIFKNIHENEIIMPSEQVGQVRDNFLWKCIMRRSQSADVPPFQYFDGQDYFDSSIFKIMWGPTVSAISTIFDKSNSPAILKKTILGFSKASQIASFYGLCDVLDNILITLCKFTTLLDSSKKKSIRTNEQILSTFGKSSKAQVAASLAFSLASHYPDTIRDGWKSILDTLLQLYKSDILSDDLLSTEEYAYLPRNRNIKITSKGPIRPKSLSNNDKQNKGSESGIISSFYSYFYPGTNESDAREKTESPKDARNQSKSPTPVIAEAAELTEDKTVIDVESDLERILSFIQSANFGPQNIDEAVARRNAVETIKACNVNQIFIESKFLQDESISYFMKAILHAIRFEAVYATPETLASSHLQMQRLEQYLKTDVSLNSKFFYQDIIKGLNFDQDNSTIQIEAITNNETKGDATENEKDANQSSLVTSAHLSSSSPSLSTLATVSNQTQQTKFFSTSLSQNIECRIFSIELLFRILIHNKDRIKNLWSISKDYLVELIMMSIQPTFLVERVFVNMIRLANRIIPRHEQVFMDVLGCLLYLMVIKSTSLLIPPDSSFHPYIRYEALSKNSYRNRKNLNKSPSRESLGNSLKNWDDSYIYENRIAQQVIGGISEIIHNHAADLSERRIWEVIFSLLEVCGASMVIIIDPYGNIADPKYQDVIPSNSTLMTTKAGSDFNDTKTENWILYDGSTTNQIDNSDTMDKTVQDCPVGGSFQNSMRDSYRSMIDRLKINVEIGLRDAKSLEKSINILMFLIKDPAYLMPDNIESCIHCLRVFTEACISNTNFESRRSSTMNRLQRLESRKNSPTLPRGSSPTGQLKQSIESSDEDWDILSRNEEESIVFPVTTRLLSQIIDMIQILFYRVNSIYAEWNKTSGDSSTTTDTLWKKCWLPLLKTTARICMDSRGEIIIESLSSIQKELLSTDLCMISPKSWGECMNQVLFPLLAAYLEDICQKFEGKDTSKTPIFNQADPRLRSIPLLTKVFLQRLDSLYELDNFSDIWNLILLFMQHFILASNFDTLTDAVREYLKNVLLVMYTGTQGSQPILVKDAPVDTKKGILWKITVERLNSFLPELLEQLSLLDQEAKAPENVQVGPIPEDCPTLAVENPPTTDCTKPVVNIIDSQPILPQAIAMATNLSEYTPYYKSPLHKKNTIPSQIQPSPNNTFFTPLTRDESAGFYDPNQYFSPPINEEEENNHFTAQQGPST